MKTIAVLNGPNLNYLGTRERAIYGDIGLNQLQKDLKIKADALGLKLMCEQSNHEGRLIDLLQEWAQQKLDAVILNAGGLSHTSVSLRDAIACMPYPVIEVHISNIYAREAFRQHSLLSAVCKGSISGCGIMGYSLALDYAAQL